MIIFECLTQCDLLLQGSKSLSETARIEKHQSELLKEKKIIITEEHHAL